MGNEKFHGSGPKPDPTFLSSHFPFLQRCIELAHQPGAAVEPNPRVGAVVVWKGQIIGEGAHRYYGGPHAEVVAVQNVAEKALLADSTLYVSLEPCNHHGKTPPCAGMILEMGIPRVVIGSLDPNPLMQGKSVDFLRSKGVVVEVAEDQSPFQALNRHFWVNQQQKRPYILLKWAESADGLISGTDVEGKPEPRAISSAAVNRHFHWLRHELQAIWIGKNTAMIDNPSLTTRLWPGRSPLRIVSDTHLGLSMDLHILKGKPTVVVNAERDVEIGDMKCWKVSDTQDLPAILHRMYAELNIGSILVEGGRQLSQQFLDLGLWDEVLRCISPQALENGVAAPAISEGLTPKTIQMIGIDRVEHFLRA